MKIAVVGVAALLVLAGCGASSEATAPPTSARAEASSASASPTPDTFTLSGQVVLGSHYGIDSSPSGLGTPCHGTLIYGDLTLGAQVVVTAKGNTVALGSITDSVEDTENNVCALAITATDVPGGLGFYQLKIGEHDAPQLSEADARATVKLSLP